MISPHSGRPLHEASDWAHGKNWACSVITSVRNALQMVNGDMNVEIDNYATAPKPTTLKIALESLMAIEFEPVLKARPRLTLMASILKFK